MILGATTDEQFGHIISLGIGGISVEVYEDIELRTVPLSEEDIHSMIEKLRSKKILSKFRGKRPIKKNFSSLIHSNFLKLLKKTLRLKR